MRIPVDWLSEHVPNNLSVRDLAYTLTNVGLEVEAIEDTAGGPVLDIKVTANRGDCLSVSGVARELAMALRVRARTREPQAAESGPAARTLANVVLEDPVLCPRYSARVVRNAKIAPSPAWAQRRLELCGLRPVNNVVDATNLVMLELGQPLHAFDSKLLRRRPGEDLPEIIVRRAQPGERLVTIDGEERALTPEVLVIADPGGPIALAGIMGGSSTEIYDGTTEILLESAHFDPVTVRRGARALGMSTEASYRFERTVDPGGTIRALDRACELISEFAGPAVEVAMGAIDAYPNPIEQVVIELRPERANALLGLSLSAAEMAAHLRQLDLEVEEADDRLRVRAPTFRQDLREEIDLVEEVARAHGYENIPETLPPSKAAIGALPAELAFERAVRHLMQGMGLSESVSSSLEAPEARDRVGLAEADPLHRAVAVSNAKSVDRSHLRTTLLTSLLDIVAHNRRHGVTDVGIFDLGRVYLADDPRQLPEEVQRLGVAAAGIVNRGRWAVSEGLARWDFYALKGVVENILQAIAGDPGEFAAEAHRSLRAGRAVRVTLRGDAIGHLGELRSEIREAYDLPTPVFVAELDLDRLRKHAVAVQRYRPVSRFPAVARDVAFLVPRPTAATRAEAIIRGAAGDGLESLYLFDAYEGRPLPEGQRNLAFSLTFRHGERTLTDGEVEEAMERIRAALREQLGARIRE
jgi:phenylalanyl-tRNA synthetase beta chain